LRSHGLNNFKDYFWNTYVVSPTGTPAPLSAWRVFDSPPGVGTTNNALESFNSYFKRTHLNRRMQQLVDLLQNMSRYTADMLATPKVNFKSVIVE
jgi:hypothetical protein